MAGVATARRSDRAVLRLLGAEAAGELAGRVVSGRQLGREHEERRRTAFPTGLAPLDELLAAGGEAHGLPRGCLVELVGQASSGRFAAVLSIVAAATSAGEAAALVDLGDHLDSTAVTDAGADADRLLWVRPRDLREALAAAETILAGGLPLVVIDLGLPPVRGGRGAEASWLRLARVAQAHGAALLVSSPYRVSGTAAHAVVGAETTSGLYAGGVGARRLPLLQGLALRFRLEKLRGHRPGALEAAELYFLGGLSQPPSPEKASFFRLTPESRLRRPAPDGGRGDRLRRPPSRGPGSSRDPDSPRDPGSSRGSGSSPDPGFSGGPLRGGKLRRALPHGVPVGLGGDAPDVPATL